MTQAKYLTICSELGATSKLGPSLKEVYKAFARRRGVLYNLMLRAVDSVKSGRQTQLEKHQAKVQTIFALCDENGDGVLAAQEIDKLTAGKATPSVHPGDRISVTRLKMLYLESHFRDLEEDFDRLRNAFKASDSSAVVSSTAQAADRDSVILLLIGIVAMLVLVVLGLTYKVFFPGRSKRD